MAMALSRSPASLVRMSIAPPSTCRRNSCTVLSWSKPMTWAPRAFICECGSAAGGCWADAATDMRRATSSVFVIMQGQYGLERFQGQEQGWNRTPMEENDRKKGAHVN